MHLFTVHPSWFRRRYVPSEWEGLGSFWVGLVAIAAGIAGICVTRAETSGGPSTGIYFFLSFITLGASLASIMLSEGIGERGRMTTTRHLSYDKCDKQINTTVVEITFLNIPFNISTSTPRRWQEPRSQDGKSGAEAGNGTQAWHARRPQLAVGGGEGGY